jgi:hypothetical protein
MPTMQPELSETSRLYQYVKKWVSPLKCTYGTHKPGATCDHSVCQSRRDAGNKLLREIDVVQYKLFTLSSATPIKTNISKAFTTVTETHFDDARVDVVFDYIAIIIDRLTEHQLAHGISTGPPPDQTHIDIINAMFDVQLSQGCVNTRQKSYDSMVIRHDKNLTAMFNSLQEHRNILATRKSTLAQLQTEYQANPSLDTIQAENTALKAKLAQLLDILK